MQTDLITKVYFNEHLTHSCVGMPQGLQALSSSLFPNHKVFSGMGEDNILVIRWTHLKGSIAVVTLVYLKY